MIYPNHEYETTPPAPAPHVPAVMVHGTTEDSFCLYYRMDPVILLTRERGRLHATEHAHAGRFMRALDIHGKEGTRIVGLLCGGEALDIPSLRALNVYLRHGPGLDTFRRAPKIKQSYPWNKYGWSGLKTHLGLLFR